MVWEIVPFIGIGNLRFGMSLEHVGELFNKTMPITRSTLHEDGSTREFRGLHFPICHYTNNELFLVDTHPGIESVFMFGCNIYNTAPIDILRMLEQQNGRAEIGLGTILYNNIGVSTTGFYFKNEQEIYDLQSGEQDDRNVGVFKKGFYDKWLHVYEKISFLD